MNITGNQTLSLAPNVLQLGSRAFHNDQVEEEDAGLPFDPLDDLLNEFADQEDEWADDDFDDEIEAQLLASSAVGGADAILDRLDLDSKEYDQIQSIQCRLTSLQELRRKMSFLMGEIGHAKGISL